MQAKQFISAPGVFDGVSAKLADQTDARALYMTGIATVASYLGLPDAGLATYSQMLDRVEMIAQSVRKPLIADGDTGYGGLLNVYAALAQGKLVKEPLYAFSDFLKVIGFQEVWDFEEKYADLLAETGMAAYR